MSSRAPLRRPFRNGNVRPFRSNNVLIRTLRTSPSSSSTSLRFSPCLSSSNGQGAGEESLFTRTAEKALAINLRNAKERVLNSTDADEPWTNYGTFAEIGAAQEVARWFFRVGGAAGTVAKSVSAYDMTISDTQYGAAKRYVTMERVQSMLEYEYLQCQLPLQTQRGSKTAFFAFADTIAARSYRGDNEQHGWLGLKFQTEPGSTPSRIIIHIRLLDNTAELQQEATGVLGVNLLHSCFTLLKGEDGPTPAVLDEFLASLMDDLGTWDDGNQRIQIDLMKFEGPAFAGVDERAVALRLVERKICEATVFDTDGRVRLPSDMFYKKNVLVLRGLFRPFTKLHEDMISAASAEFFCEEEGNPSRTIYESTKNGQDEEVCYLRDASQVLLEISTADITHNGDSLDWTTSLGLDEKKFLNRLDAVLATGHPVMLSNFFEYFRVAQYLQQAIGKGKGHLAIVLGVPAIKSLFDEQYYKTLSGGILENFGRMARADLSMYLYPTVDEKDNVITANTLELTEEVDDLYQFLLKRKVIRPVEFFDKALLAKFGSQSASKKVSDMVESGDDAWMEYMPGKVVDYIKENGTEEETLDIKAAVKSYM
ncbi:hypothetical protein PPROV_000458700 [Pycnococcus provasolii]|uniref:Uncharacterized protein n=1 Tax=Pycnococcus provasolii TaxID=41880 RepID=A0A830HJ47_9CHLO|nr:hypothetical protein PPROV_000458700 [Pycnococcus provasolii]